ncbi:DNA-binding response regulator, OmpR family, contains REC and winged-helix (wHTH) domain [Halolactibacillus miurensis]|uniref:DNA-binding response regulator, OmpR family, contains REC and winged-helix (WHTH) domain n=2 Tax=Halolactibacillus miurensis TaxID=306541 RepID=A0A1I6P2C2_9BACI|nr:DNA-binding response regulator, OmpR family, contains REC and winged-helix (wHTH) domain [Halolactibacillus miurensis]
MTMEKIMIVEDDPKIAEYLAQMLQKYNYQVVKVTDFEQVLETFQTVDPQLVLLDINLPAFDGFYWCRQIRKTSVCPVIFISARTGDMDQVMALENGGDDYITKPFHPDIVMAKIRSHLRRAYGEYAQNNQERTLELTGLILRPERLELLFNQQTVTLTQKEAAILEALMERYPRVKSRGDLLELLWDDETYVDENTLNVNITRARKKLHELGLNNTIETVRGSGYRFNVSWREDK